MGILVIQENRKARHDYQILEVFEAGLCLTGSEVKSLRERNIQFKDSYITFKGNEAWWQNAHIAEYKSSSYNNHEPGRLRKLLLHRREMDKISSAIREKGLTCIPLRIYFKNGKAKLEIALAKGKTKFDKRESIKKRDAQARIRQTLRQTR
ncbi:MAG: SsrA-binding protein SmpB [Bdellovibrionaceae bacterium]|nr:SsrA-binding protein SmpB [Pseudobdellovibrionaceae bacterium]